MCLTQSGFRIGHRTIIKKDAGNRTTIEKNARIYGEPDAVCFTKLELQTGNRTAMK